MSTPTTTTPLLERSKGWVWWIVGLGVILIAAGILWDQFGSSIPGKEHQQTVRLIPEKHNHLKPREVCDLPKGTWKYDVQAPPMMLMVEGREIPIAIGVNHPGAWGLMLENALPKGKVVIGSSGCGNLQFDIPTQQINFVSRGEYQLAQAIDITLVLR